MEPNWWNGLILKMTSRRTFEFCRSATLISPTSAPKAKDSLPWTPWSRCRLSGKTRWSGGKVEVAGGRPGEPGEPRGRVRGGRLQPASQPVGQDRAARERNAWKVTTDQHWPSLRFSSISPQITRWGPNHAADPVVTRWKREPVSFKEKLSFFLQNLCLRGSWKGARGTGGVPKFWSEGARVCLHSGSFLVWFPNLTCFFIQTQIHATLGTRLHSSFYSSTRT